MSPKLPKPNMAEIAAAQGEAIDSRYHPSAAVRRQLNKVFPTHWSFLLGEIALYSFIVAAAHRRLPVAVLRPVDGRNHLRRRLPTAARRGDVEGLRVDPRHQLRSARRPVRPPGPPLGGAVVRRGDHGAPGPHLLHRRVPPSARGQLGDRLAAADPGDVRGLLRLLTARRPAVGHRLAGGAELDLAGHAGDRHAGCTGRCSAATSRAAASDTSAHRTATGFRACTRCTSC